MYARNKQDSVDLPYNGGWWQLAVTLWSSVGRTQMQDVVISLQQPTKPHWHSVTKLPYSVSAE